MKACGGGTLHPLKKSNSVSKAADKQRELVSWKKNVEHFHSLLQGHAATDSGYIMRAFSEQMFTHFKLLFNQLSILNSL